MWIPLVPFYLVRLSEDEVAPTSCSAEHTRRTVPELCKIAHSGKMRRDGVRRAQSAKGGLVTQAVYCAPGGMHPEARSFLQKDIQKGICAPESRRYIRRSQVPEAIHENSYSGPGCAIVSANISTITGRGLRGARPQSAQAWPNDRGREPSPTLPHPCIRQRHIQRQPDNLVSKSISD